MFARFNIPNKDGLPLVFPYCICADYIIIHFNKQEKTSNILNFFGSSMFSVE
jgi:hypothetical protein